eukprot:3377054-Alexandrium_andersonii.AAC.1
MSRKRLSEPASDAALDAAVGGCCRAGRRQPCSANNCASAGMRKHRPSALARGLARAEGSDTLPEACGTSGLGLLLLCRNNTTTSSPLLMQLSRLCGRLLSSRPQVKVRNAGTVVRGRLRRTRDLRMAPKRQQLRRGGNSFSACSALP